jgi:hypothetical protein
MKDYIADQINSWTIMLATGSGLFFGVLLDHYLPLCAKGFPWWMLLIVFFVRIIIGTIVLMWNLYHYEG